MFDPESVARITVEDGEAMIGGTWVAASDYNQLLALYREALRQLGAQSPMSLSIPEV